MRTLLIGDIHGGLRGLVQALERCEYKKEGDKLIFVGDYVDGWSESAEVVNYLIELDGEAKEKSIFLMGNHDEWCKDWLNSGVEHRAWGPNGGSGTINSYIMTKYLTNETHRTFFNNLKLYHIDDDNRAFVHAGFNSVLGLGKQLYGGEYIWDRDMWKDSMFAHGKLDKYRVKPGFTLYKEVYIGHTPTINWNCKPHYPEANTPKQETLNGVITVPMNRCNVWNIDTGAGWGGKLTIMDIDTKEYWQSDKLSNLYPEEKGR